MKPPARQLDPTQLMEHASWMRALARKLVVDADLADDVVQSAWSAAIARPPRRGVPLRAWLANVVRNQALTGRRASVRREARERESARPEREVSTVELAERAEQQGLLIQSVQRLPESYRDVVLLRYFEDMKPAAIAAKLGIPVATVRTRLARALDRLREDLDATHGGDRRAWCLALIPLASSRKASGGALSFASSSSLLATLAMQPIKLIALLVVVVAALLGARSLDSLPALFSSRVRAERIATPEAAASRLFERRASVERTSRAPVPIDRTVSGRVVDLDGLPIRGATVGRAWQARVVERALSGFDGTFEWTLAEGRGWPGIRAEHPDFMALRSETTTGPNEECELTLAPVAAFPLTVTVFDTGLGVELPRFRLTCTPLFEDVERRYRPEVLQEEVLTGRFEGDVAFPVSLSMRVRVQLITGRDTFASAEQVIQPRPGTPVSLRFEVDLHAPERDPDASIVTGRVVDAETQEPIGGVRVVTKPLVEEKPEMHGSQVHPTRRFDIHAREVQTLTDGTFRVALPHGGPEALVYTMHPHYQVTWAEFDGSTPVEIPIPRRGALRVQVLDSGGAPIVGVPLLLRSMTTYDAFVSPGDDVDLRAFTDDEGRFELPGLRAGSYSVSVLPEPQVSDDEAFAHRSCDLQAGEVLDLVLRLGSEEGVTVSGIVRGAATGWVPWFVPYSADGACTIGRPAGIGYEAMGIEPGRYAVVLAPSNDDDMGDMPLAILTDVVVGERFVQAMDFDLPDGSLHGRITGSAALGRLTVHAKPVLPRGFASELFASAEFQEQMRHPVGPDGSFEVQGLASGEYRLELREGTRLLAERTVDVQGVTAMGPWTVED